MPYRILLVSSTGLVGKSTAVASLLYPRLPGNLKVFSVEEQNQDASRYGIPVIRYRAAEFAVMWEDLQMETANALVDVGASNYLDFMDALLEFPGVVNDFDAVVVPCTPDRRTQEEAVTTVEDLSKVGLDPDKLRVLFNRSTARRGTPPDDEFQIVVAYLQLHPEYHFYPDLVIPNRGVHSNLAAAGKSINDVLKDTRDYAAEIEDAVTRKDDAGKRKLVHAQMLKIAVTGAEGDLQAAFEALRLPFREAIEDL